MKLTVPFVLASRSPRRRRLLERIGMRFEVDASDVDEDLPDGRSPDELVRALAERKARIVAPRHVDALIMGADTVVVFEGSVLGKPADPREAAEMLHRLSEATHTVYTGIALVHPATNRTVSAYESTRVTFGPLDPDEIAAYVSSGSPMDKAGGYGIQDDRGALFVRRIEGDYYNVVGLPLHRFYRMMKRDFSDLLACDYLA
ncbi:MAG: nucleoside triphosphate pyrophosphatase [Rhodothermales bacterium]